MIAVGLWAAQLGGRALWAVPLTFVGIMAVGGVLGMTGVGLPFTETGILASVLALGVIVAAAVRLPLAWSMALVGFLALFHGQAHGAEMPPDSSGLAFAVGFLLATAALHATGIGIGIFFKQRSTPILTRAAGACVALLGVWLVIR
jgi:urease accessory protein